MKLNKSILGLGGIMALTLTACHDDPVYEPAPQPVTPPAYFNMSDEQVVDLEEDSKDFIVPLYRANGGAAQTVNVTTTVSAEEGVNANVFDIPQTVTFEEGMTRADMVIKLDMADIVPLKEYDFTFKVDGESNPYLITDVAYTVMYTPWETVVDPANPDQPSLLKQDGWLTRPFEMNVLVQEQPSKPGFFRVRHPYYGMPEIEGGEQLYPESDPLWLYINATNARAAYFSDSRGKTPETFYRTGYKIDVYGEMVLVCVYSNYLNQKPLQIPGDDGAYAYDQFASFAGTFDNGVISWGGNMIFYADPSLIGAYQMDDWRIQLAAPAILKNGSRWVQPSYRTVSSPTTSGRKSKATQSLSSETSRNPARSASSTSGPWVHSPAVPSPRQVLYTQSLTAPTPTACSWPSRTWVMRLLTRTSV